ncbi:hypothetical protein LMG33810_002813 [Carnimonas sp. LMG 33810]
MLAYPFGEAVLNLMMRDHVTIMLAVELDFKEGPARAHTGMGELVIDGEVYYGVGAYGSIETVSESANSTSPMSVQLSLSGLDRELVAGTIVDRCRGRRGRLMLVALADDGSYAADVLFDGSMDAANLSAGGNAEQNTISVRLTDRMAQWQRPGTEIWSDESHRSRHGDDDRFFRYIGQMDNRPIYWGAKRDAPSFKYN